MDMHRYTTPTHSIIIRGADLSDCRVWLTVAQDKMHRHTFDVTDTKEEIAGSESPEWRVRLRLDQIQTARLIVGKKAMLQANIQDRNGYRACSDIKEMSIGGNLLDRVV